MSSKEYPKECNARDGVKRHTATDTSLNNKCGGGHNYVPLPPPLTFVRGELKGVAEVRNVF